MTTPTSKTDELVKRARQLGREYNDYSPIVSEVLTRLADALKAAQEQARADEAAMREAKKELAGSLIAWAERAYRILEERIAAREPAKPTCACSERGPCAYHQEIQPGARSDD